MIFAMLSNLLLARSLLESCFSYFTVKVSKDFSVIAVPRERSKLVPLKAMLTGNPTPLANAAVSPVITVNLIKPVSTIPVIILNFFGNPFTSFNFLKKKSLYFGFCPSDMPVVLVVL